MTAFYPPSCDTIIDPRLSLVVNVLVAAGRIAGETVIGRLLLSRRRGIGVVVVAAPVVTAGLTPFGVSSTTGS